MTISHIFLDVGHLPPVNIRCKIGQYLQGTAERITTVHSSFPIFRISILLHTYLINGFDNTNIEAVHEKLTELRQKWKKKFQSKDLSFLFRHLDLPINVLL
uniref:Uncharacterized protein n=1 Tax=Heterorhabditis bacteriophora TaxID=37862 RepID=A0A1I7WBG9_HETBA